MYLKLFYRSDSCTIRLWRSKTKHYLTRIYTIFFTEDHLLITNLRPAIPYTVVVEARKMEKYKDVDEGKFKELDCPSL